MSAPTTNEASAALNLNAANIANMIISAREAVKEGSDFSKTRKSVEKMGKNPSDYLFPIRSPDYSRMLANKTPGLMTSGSQTDQLKSKQNEFAEQVVEVVLRIIDDPSCKKQFLLEQINGDPKKMMTEKDLTETLSITTLREGSKKVDAKTQGHGHESAA